MSTRESLEYLLRTTLADCDVDDAIADLDAYRAEVLRDAADSESWGDDDQREWLVIGIRSNLRRMADDPGQGETGGVA